MCCEFRLLARWQCGERASVVFGTAAIATGFARDTPAFQRLQQQLCRVAALQPSLGQFCLLGREVQCPYDGALSCPREVLGKPDVVSSWDNCACICQSEGACICSVAASNAVHAGSGCRAAYTSERLIKACYSGSVVSDSGVCSRLCICMPAYWLGQ